MILHQCLIVAAAPVWLSKNVPLDAQGWQDRVTVLLLGSGTAPTDRYKASQSLVNDSALYEGPQNGPFCPSIKYRGVTAPHQDQHSIELCILAHARQVSSTAQLLVVVLQVAQCMSKAG